jgi:hypothetical protein
MYEKARGEGRRGWEKGGEGRRREERVGGKVGGWIE